MSLFLKDLIHDLREKRLWPVAALLAVAIVAIPLVMLNGGGTEASDSPAAPGPAAAGTGGLAPAQLRADAGGGVSDLDQFKSKNPFRSTDKKSIKSAIPAGGSPPDPSSGSSPTVSKGGSRASGTNDDGNSTGGSTGSPSDPSSAFGQGKGRSDSPSGTVRRRIVSYKYTIDVDFGEEGTKLSRRRSVDQLATLPRGEHPLVIFLGVTSDGRRAVFGLGPRLTQSGEGTCRPSRDRCTFVELRTSAKRNSHILVTPAGRRYVLRLLAIRREPIKKASASSAARVPQMAAGVSR